MMRRTPTLITVMVLLTIGGCSQSDSTSTEETTTTVVASAATSVEASSTAGIAPTAANRVLFVGNSYTSWNDGLDHHFVLLAGSAEPPLNVKAEAETMGGAPLKLLWANPGVRDAITDGEYDVVVFQGDIPVTDVGTFYEYVRSFVALVKEVGAEPILFMARDEPARDWIDVTEIAEAHRQIAAELDVRVAPVGLAWQQASEERPDISMHWADDPHPSLAATYLAANVIYATIF